MSKTNRATGPALEAMYRFLLWLTPTVEKFPRSQKFTLGDRIETAALDVLERLIEATYQRDRRAPLTAANLGLQKLRIPSTRRELTELHPLIAGSCKKAQAKILSQL